MSSKLLTLVAAGALALTASTAMAQRDGAPSNERDQSGATTDSSQNSANPDRAGGTQGQGSGTMGRGGSANSPAMGDPTPLQPGGVSPSAPPQGSESAQPRPR